jgi:hypothetical protein
MTAACRLKPKTAISRHGRCVHTPWLMVRSVNVVEVKILPAEAGQDRMVAAVVPSPLVNAESNGLDELKIYGHRD